MNNKHLQVALKHYMNSNVTEARTKECGSCYEPNVTALDTTLMFLVINSFLARIKMMLLH